MDQIELILASIVEALDLQHEDHVVDLGCGNGLVSERIAAITGSVLGIDVSPRLVEDARRFRATKNLGFAVGDFTDPALLADWPGAREVGTNWKWYAYEVIQHLAPEEMHAFLKTVAAKVQHAEGGPTGSLQLFLGSIPDLARIHSFYDTPERWDLFERNRAAGVEQIGTWWQQKDLQAMTEELGFQCRIMEQDSALYTSHYRFHALLTIPGRTRHHHA
ncbi:MAG: methyltransferase domain-containing protein [Planctomycetota bacterium]